jgi:hypothetical protein
MKRMILMAAVATVCLQPMVAAAQPGAPAPQHASLTGEVPALTQGLIDAAFRLPDSASPDDFLQAFLAEIAAAGANQVVVFSAIDAAIGTPGLSRPALAALESLRKRVHSTRDYTAAVGDHRSGIYAPGTSMGGGSDYTR